MGWRKFSTTYPFQTPGHTLTRVTLVNPVRGMVVTSCLLTRKRKLREVKWLLQGHTARSGFEPRTLIPKLFPFHDLCWCCRVAVSPVRTPTASGRGHSRAAPGGNGALSGAVRPLDLALHSLCSRDTGYLTFQWPLPACSCPGVFLPALTPLSLPRMYVYISLIINGSLQLQGQEQIWLLREGKGSWSRNWSARWQQCSTEPQKSMSKAKPLGLLAQSLRQLSVRAGMTFRMFFPSSKSPCWKNDKTEAQKQ